MQSAYSTAPADRVSTKDRRKRTTKTRKNQDARRKGNLGILKADTIKQAEIKERIKKEYPRKTRKLLETKLRSGNLIKGINSRAVGLVRYSGQFSKWAREKLQQRTTKLITIHKVLYPTDDVDRLCVKKKREKEDSPAFKIASMHR